MAHLEVNCKVERNKRTGWMNRMMSAIGNTQWKHYDGTTEELQGIQSGLNHFIRQLRMSGQLNAELDTELNDNVLVVKKNGRVFITAQFK